MPPHTSQGASMEVLGSERVAIEQGSFEQAAWKGWKYQKSAQKTKKSSLF
jgi:hypothetical protein